MFKMPKSFSPNGLELKSPLKQVMSSAEINQALRTKRQKTGTGGITMDNTLVGVGTGTAVKAGIRKAASKTAGKWTGKKTGAIADVGIEVYGLNAGK
jgi:hypothetical protein